MGAVVAPKPVIQFIRACSTGKPDIVRDLLQGGLSTDTRDQYGLTGLIWAARKGQVEVARVLLAADADVNATDRLNRTALAHAVMFKRSEFVQFIASRGANLESVDAHGWTPLDHAIVPKNPKIIEILVKLGAKTRFAEGPLPAKNGPQNSFGSGGASGGPDFPIEIDRTRIQLNTALHHWRGNYTAAVEKFYFPLYVDGSVVCYTDQMKIWGGQKAKRKKNWLEVQIGVPELWWRQGEAAYKDHLTAAIEEGLHSMIALLQRNKHEIKAELLLADWRKVKQDFLNIPAPPYPAEKQRARMLALVAEITERRKSTVRSTQIQHP
jgi:hypothetical protein